MLSDVVARARRIRRSDGFKSAAGIPKLFLVKSVQRANRGIFSIQVESRTGFFAIMQMVLFILTHCEEKGLYPDVSAAGGIYGEPSAKVDWFRQLFDCILKPDGAIADRLQHRSRILTSKIKDISELGFRPKYEMGLTLAGASELFNRTYRPTADVLAEVDSSAKRLGISSSSLALHYRGTDKVHEAAPMPWATVCERVQTVLRSRPGLTEIFMATDDVSFAEYFQSQRFNLPVIAAPARYLPKGDKPVHFSGHPGLAIGREALITCLLLARCGFLIKTPSYLSAWSKVLNPSLEVWLISPSIGAGFFPDRVLWADQVSGKVAFPAPLTH